MRINSLIVCDFVTKINLLIFEKYILWVLLDFVVNGSIKYSNPFPINSSS